MNQIAISEEQLREIRNWAERKPRIEQIMLFGSRAKGTSRPDSDIDLAVSVTEDQRYTRATIWFYDSREWSQMLTEQMGVKIDIRITDVASPCHIRRYCEEAGNIVIYTRTPQSERNVEC